MILLILMILIVVNSLHRDYMEMKWLSYHVLCELCMLFKDVFNVNKCCVKCPPVVPLCYIDKPHGGIFDMPVS